MDKAKKYDIPVLIDPRLQKSEYCSPMNIVLYVDKKKKPYLVSDLIKDKNELQAKASDLEAENKNIKECCIKLCALVATINSTTISAQIDTASIINQIDMLKNTLNNV